MIRGTLVLLVGLAATSALGRRSASLRHLVLAVTIACAAVMPFAQRVVPTWELALLPAPAEPTAPALTLSDTDSSSPVAATPEALVTETSRRPSMTSVLFVAWAAGTTVCLLALALGIARLLRVARHATPVTDGPWVEAAREVAACSGLAVAPRLVQSDHPSLLFTWGFHEPRVFLPRDASDWSDARIRIVLAHELAHVRRGDWLIQLFAECVRCIYWFNPLVWFACHRLRLESEHAADDAVLRLGVAPSEYAGHLVELARLFRQGRSAHLPAPAMSRPSDLERRVRIMLDAGLDRSPVSRFSGVFLVLVMLALALPLAGLSVVAASPATQSPAMAAVPTPAQAPSAALAPSAPPAAATAVPAPAAKVRPARAGGPAAAVAPSPAPAVASAPSPAIAPTPAPAVASAPSPAVAPTPAPAVASAPSPAVAATPARRPVSASVPAAVASAPAPAVASTPAAVASARPALVPGPAAVAPAPTPVAAAVPRASAPRPARAPDGQAAGTATLKGDVKTQFGRGASKVALTLVRISGGDPIEKVTDASGNFAFDAVPPGDYQLKGRKPGFKAFTVTMTLQAGQVATPRVTLQVGKLEETVIVSSPAGAVPPSTPAIPRARHVGALTAGDPCGQSDEGGCITPPRKLADAAPFYPANHRASGRSGVVVIKGHVKPDGTVADLEPEAGSDPDFAKTAMQAIRLWQFSPTRIDGTAIEIDLTVTVNFQISTN